jgi:hypothetical protein
MSAGEMGFTRSAAAGKEAIDLPAAAVYGSPFWPSQNML